MHNFEWRKVIGALVAGWLGFAGAFVSFEITFQNVNLNFVWSLFIPLIISVAWGRRYALITALPGLAALFPFFLWPHNGWALLLDAIVYIAWFYVNAYFAEGQRNRAAWYYNIYMVQVYFSVFIIIGYTIFFKWLFKLNPPFWNTSLTGSIANSAVLIITVKSLLNIFGCAIIANGLLILPPVKKLFGKPVHNYSRFNTRIMTLFLGFGMLLMVLNETVSHIFRQPGLEFWSVFGLPMQNPFFNLIILTFSIQAGITVVRFSEKRLRAEQLLSELRDKLEIIVRERTEEYECANEELVAVNEELNSTNDALKAYQENLENIVLERTAEIRELHGLFDEIFRNTSDAIFIVDMDAEGYFRFSRLNTVAEKTLGLKISGSDKGVRLDDVKDSIQVTYFGKNYRLCANEGIPINYEETLNIKGNITYWNTTLVPIKNKEGQVTRIAAFARDLTMEKEVTEALAESEEKFRLLFEKMMNAFILFAPVYDDNHELADFRYVMLNPAYTKHSSIPAEYCINKKFSEVHTYPEAQDTFERYKEVFATGISQRFEAYSKVYDRYFDMYVYKPAEEKLAVMFMDITQQKKAALELTQTSNYLKIIIQASPFAIIDLNKAGKISSIWNPAAERLFGWNCDEVIGKSLPYIPENSIDEHKDINDRVFKGECFDNIDLKRKRRDGTDIYIRIALAPLRNSDNKIDHILAMMQDITEIKLMEQKLIETIVETEENERRRLAADLHDELGPQLAAMRMYISSLKRSIDAPEYNDKLNSLMDIIKDAVVNIREISANLSPYLLDKYGLVAALKIDFKNKEHLVSINFNENFGEKRTNLKTEIALYRIIKELLNNSLKYANASKIDISLLRNAEEINLEYTDNGNGFDYDELMNTAHQGMGLSNIQTRVKTLRGESITFSKKGKGFRFTLKVPELITESIKV